MHTIHTIHRMIAALTIMAAGCGSPSEDAPNGWPIRYEGLTIAPPDTTVPKPRPPSASDLVTLGPECNDPLIESIGNGPLNGEVEDELGHPIHENNAVVARCWVVQEEVSVTSAMLGLWSGSGTNCSKTMPVEALVWGSPTIDLGDVSAASATAAVVPIDVLSLVWSPTGAGEAAIAQVDLPQSVVVPIGGAACVGARMHVDDVTGAISCVDQCKMKDPSLINPKEQLWTDTNDTGVVDLCPDSGPCDFEPLSLSPTPALAVSFKNDWRKTRFWAIGTKL